MSTPTLTLPEDPSLLTRLRVGVQALLVAKEEPSNPYAGYMINRCFDREVYQSLALSLKETEGGRRILAERPSIQPEDLDLDALLALPEDTFGHAVARYYRENGIGPFETKQATSTDDDYLTKRYRETHDFHHVLTGYGTDELGEMELQAFIRGNFGLRSALFIVVFGLVASTLAGAPMASPATYVKRCRAAQRRGAAVRNLLTVRFEDYFPLPLQEVRALILTPQTEGVPLAA